ncbi:MAG: GNAT family N-acetyltransferase [Chloroflexi bacterium]|nr:GNAT family N-acetyltransferase [Chloroflexota bacterium]
MEIITATEKHVPEIVELWKEFMDFHRPIDPRFPLRKDAHLNWVKHLRELMKSENACALVGLDKGQAVAYCIIEKRKYAPIWEREYYGLISDMFVRADYRRKGAGEQVFARMIEWFKANKIDRVDVTVADGNQLGYPFWKKHGFKDYISSMYLDLK